MTSPDYKCTLNLKETARKDTGKLKLTVSNEYGSDSCEIEVVVLGMCFKLISVYTSFVVD